MDVREQWQAEICTALARKLPAREAIAQASELIALLTPAVEREKQLARKAERNRWDYQRRQGER